MKITLVASAALPLRLILLLSIFATVANSNPTTTPADSDVDLTTKSDKIVTETFELQPNANISRRTNFTLLDEDISKKIILEMWVERKNKTPEP